VPLGQARWGRSIGSVAISLKWLNRCHTGGMVTVDVIHILEQFLFTEYIQAYKYIIGKMRLVSYFCPGYS
jgi:hypothetical protein